jgi:DNA repair exonuclease SbcCD ATPase subunit
MGILQNVKETAEDAMGTGPTAELEEFFDTDWSRFDYRSIPEARELLDNLQQRRQSEREKMQAPSRYPSDGDRPSKVAREAERRVEWLTEQIEAGRERVEELEERRRDLREQAAAAEEAAKDRMRELAAEALDGLEGVEETVEAIKDARQRIIDARKKADLRTGSHRPHPAKSAEKKLRKLRATLNQLAETDE